jgi:hypothetical protein
MTAHPELASRCPPIAAAAKLVCWAKFLGKKHDKIDAAEIADCPRWNFLPECHMASTEIRDRRRVLRHRNLLVKQMVHMRNLVSELSELAFSHSFCLRDVAWIRLAYALTKRDDVGTTSPTVLTR